MPSTEPCTSPVIDLTTDIPPTSGHRRATTTRMPKALIDASIDVVDLISDSEDDHAPSPPVRTPHSLQHMSIPHRSRESVDLDQSTPRKRHKSSKNLFVTGDSSPSAPSSEDGVHTPSASPQRESRQRRTPATNRNSHIGEPVDDGIEQLLDVRSIDAIVPHRLDELKQDTAYSTRALLKRARLAAPTRSKAPSRAAAKVFAALTPMAAAASATREKVGKGKLLLQTESWPTLSTRSVKQSIKLTPAEHNLKEKNAVPRYCHILRLQESILSPNVTMLNCWPYFSDEYQPDKAQFEELYAVDVDNRSEKLNRVQYAQWLFEPTEVALSEAGLSWSDILGLLCSDDKVLDAKGLSVDAFHDVETPSYSSRWNKCSKAIGSFDKLFEAYEFCAAFQQASNLSIWHLLRRSQMVRTYFANPEDDIVDHGARECRICFRFDCTLHGEIQQYDADSTDDSEADDDPADATDIVNPPRANFRKPVNFNVSEHKEDDFPANRRYRSYWENKGFMMPDSMSSFNPCHHPGMTCEQASCSCSAAGVPCEKSCTCSATCARKFQGCACSTTKQRRPGEFVCWKDDRCACYTMGRECDPDLCGKCGVHDTIDIGKPSSELMQSCHNASIQRGLPKHTLLGDSAVHELGLYACEHIHPHDFVGEYKGEIITKDEAERRGAIYEQQKLSYLFTLNSAQEVDSTYCGNKIRFINHNSRGLRNVYAVIMLVNTVHRIALFAEKHIQPGEELFFDYGPQFPHEQLGGKKVSKAAPVARNQALLNDFADPQGVRSKTKTSKDALKKGVAKVVVKNARASDKSSRSASAAVEPRDAGSRLNNYNIADDSELDDGDYSDLESIESTTPRRKRR